MADAIQWGLATPRPIDFSWLGNLPDVYRQAQQDSQQQAVQNAFARGFPKDANGNPDFTKMQSTLLGLPGGFQAAAQIAALQKASEPEFKMGTDALGNQIPLFVDPGKQTVTQGTIQGQPGQPTQGPSNSVDANGQPLAGEDFLAATPISEGLKAQVRAIARGDQLPPPRASKLGVMLGNLVNQYDPTFSQSVAPTRIATRKAFAIGRQGDAVTALNTLPGHMAALSADTDALGGADTSLGYIDRWLNYGNQWLARGGSSATGKALAKFETDMTPVSEELERVWRGAGGNMGEIEQWRQSFNAANGPTAKHAALSRLASLVQSRVDSLKDQYVRGMGTDQYGVPLAGGGIRPPDQLVRPEDQNILDTLSSGGQLPSNNGGDLPPALNSPKGGLIRTTPANGGQSPEGTIISNGKQQLIKRNGQWVPMQ